MQINYIVWIRKHYSETLSLYVVLLLPYKRRGQQCNCFLFVCLLFVSFDHERCYSLCFCVDKGNACGWRFLLFFLIWRMVTFIIPSHFFYFRSAHMVFIMLWKHNLRSTKFNSMSRPCVVSSLSATKNSHVQFVDPMWCIDLRFLSKKW